MYSHNIDQYQRLIAPGRVWLACVASERSDKRHSAGGLQRASSNGRSAAKQDARLPGAPPTFGAGRNNAKRKKSHFLLNSFHHEPFHWNCRVWECVRKAEHLEVLSFCRNMIVISRCLNRTLWTSQLPSRSLPTLWTWTARSTRIVRLSIMRILTSNKAMNKRNGDKSCYK